MPFAVAIALGVTYFRLTVVLVSLIAGASGLRGTFSYSYRVVEVFIGQGQHSSSALDTRSSREPHAMTKSALRTRWRGCSSLAVIVGVWLAMCIELGAGFRSQGDRRACGSAGRAVLQIQGLAVMGTFVAAALAFPLLALRRYRAVMVTNLFGLLATVAPARL